MKMSDVFALPVKRVGDTLADQGGYADVEYAIDAAAHAINQHDALVESLRIAVGHIKEICELRNVPLPKTSIDRCERVLSGEIK